MCVGGGGVEREVSVCVCVCAFGKFPYVMVGRSLVSCVRVCVCVCPHGVMQYSIVLGSVHVACMHVPDAIPITDADHT